MRRKSLIATTLMVILLGAGQTYADAFLSFGKLFGPRHGSFGFSISIIDPAPVCYQPTYVVPAPVYSQPTYVVPAPVYSQPTYVVPAPPPVYYPQPVVIQRPVFVQTPVYVPQPYGYPTYYQVPQPVRQGHWGYQPMRGWDGGVRYQRGYGNH